MAERDWICAKDRRALALAGAVMVAHFALLAALKWSRAVEGEMLWVSHAALLLGGIGLLLSSREIITTAFAGVAVLHALWVFDLGAGLATGTFPIGSTRYAVGADWRTIAGTSHHLYLAPVLGLWLVRARAFPLRSAVGACVLIAALTAASRAFVPPALNVNFAHALLPESRNGALVWFNALPWWSYLAVHAGVSAALFVAPVALIARAVGRSRCQGAKSERLVPARVSTRRHATAGRGARAFTLVELIAVIVVLAILGGVALPRYINYSSQAKSSADNASIAGITSALSQTFLKHRVDNAPSGQWVTSVAAIGATMHTGALPDGITISGAQLVDRRGSTYDFTAETASSAARVVLATGSGGS